MLPAKSVSDTEQQVTGERIPLVLAGGKVTGEVWIRLIVRHGKQWDLSMSVSGTSELCIDYPARLLHIVSDYTHKNLKL